MTDENRPLIPNFWTKEIEEQLSVNNIDGLFGDLSKFPAPKKKRISKRNIYDRLGQYVFRLYMWLEKKYWEEHDKVWNPKIKERKKND